MKKAMCFIGIVAFVVVAEAKVWNVRDFGAKGDGVAKDTPAIQKAIDAASTSGGGEVLLPEGVYLSGTLFLKSGVDFHLEKGATLKGSPTPADYNAADIAPQNYGKLGVGDNTSGGHLICCIEQRNITLRGPGKIDGNVGSFLKMPDGSHPPKKLLIPWRPSQMVWFVESQDIAIRDIELADAPYWSCFIHGCENVTVERANIHTVRKPHTYNGDGLDIDCSRHVRVSGCTISTADDSITLRANGTLLKRKGDCTDVRVEDCTFSSDCNAIRIGVGNSPVHDCTFKNIKISNTRYAVNCVGAYSKRVHGVDISDVSFSDIEIEARGFCKFYYGKATGCVFKGISFKHVRGKVREPSIFNDTPTRPFLDLRFEDVRLEGETAQRIVAAVAIVAAAECKDANVFSRVSCDTSSLPEEQRFVADLLASRIEVRTPPSATARTLSVRFAIDASVPGENATITVKDGRAAVTAGRFRGLVQGAGALLRRIRFGRDMFALADGVYTFAPRKELRMAYFARHFHNWYHHATAEELTEYIDDLVLAGHNAFAYQYNYPVFNLAGAKEDEKRRFAEVSKKAYDRIRALDCWLLISGGGNQAPKNSPEKFRAVRNSDPKRGNAGFNVCPAKPGAMDFLMESRKRGLKSYPEGFRADFIRYWPFDEGGCECDTCKPWGGNGFLKLIEKFAPLYKAAFPEAKTIVSTWTFHDDDWAGLYKWLETYNDVDYILADAHGDFPKYPLEHPVPRNIPIITFPEISMWGRDYWGAYGATMMPRRFERLFRQAERISSGFSSYSEGRYEDVNKEVVVGLYVNPSASCGDLLRSYASFYLAGTDPEDFVRLCGILEDNHEFPGGHHRPVFSDVPEDSEELAAYRKRAAEACRIAEKMDGEMLPALRKSWRWRLLFLRTVIDREILASREKEPKSAKPYFNELKKLDQGPNWCWHP